MATYNRANLILETLASIQAQQFSDFECIIIDDGGSDNTVTILEPILKEDSRFVYFKRSEAHQKGLPGCRNYGISLAQGKHIIFFDDDDIVHPLNLELCVEELKRDDIEYCRYQRTVFYGEFNYEFDYSIVYDKQFLNSSHVQEMIIGTLPFNSCAVMWNANCFANNTFNENLMFAEEWECYSRILADGVKGVSINKILFFGRKHDQSNTGEYQQKNPIRVQGKIEAALAIMNNLDSKKMLNKPLGNYFLALSKRMAEPIIFTHLVGLNQMKNKERLRLKIRYWIYPIFMFFYKLKKS